MKDVVTESKNLVEDGKRITHTSISQIDDGLKTCFGVFRAFFVEDFV